LSRKIKPSRRPTSKRHTLAEREWIITRYDAALERGLARSDVARGLNTSVPSINRWKLARNPSRDMPLPTPAQELSIDLAIARLADTTNNDRLSFLEALFKLVTRLRWPTQLGDHPAAITVCVVAYLSQRRPGVTIDQLDPEDATLLQRHLRLDTIARMFSSETYFAMPTFEPWYFLDQQKYDRSDLLADIAWFMIAYKSPSDDPRDAASLHKAYYATQHNIFRYKWNGVHRTFRTIWLEYGASAPFHYVERHHPGVEFTLEPSSADFAQSVDELIQSPGGIRVYLGLCRDAVNLMLKRLDRRALLTVHFPRFPDDLPAQSIRPRELPAITSAVMKGFGRSDKR
jgi:hypothetical protein